MEKQKGFTAVELITVVFVIAGAVGWILNIVALAHADFSAFNGMLVLRIIGIFVAPLGAILGYC